MTKPLTLAVSVLAVIPFLASAQGSEIAAYQAARAVVMDCQLDPYAVPDPDTDPSAQSADATNDATTDATTGDGPDLGPLPSGELYAGQSCVTIDEIKVAGDLTLWTERGVITAMSYSFEACQPCKQADAWSCQRQCYTLGDSAVTLGYTGDGRVYEMQSYNGGSYDVHWVRRESDPDSPDPSAIFQLTLRQHPRAITLLMIYRLTQED